ncbi:MAG: lipoyl synthase [Methanomassiliicoccales archaeon PtaU1.Bin124]|nr:MAG: lipoyl synthase [Methanomassiliicoccales archaeon PtaU1.Bin124]
MDEVLPKPDWLRVRASYRPEIAVVREVLHSKRLRTVCDSSHCPNLCDCWSRKSATFLILGSRCSRSCRFCAVDHSPPDGTWERDEPERLARAVAELGLDYVVVTSVTRDDLPDGGAAAYRSVVEKLHELAPGCGVELLIPDLQGNKTALEEIVCTSPSVLGHNIEVVPRLQGWARDPMASLSTSLAVLRMAKEIDPRQVTKSSLMLGLGESDDEVRESLELLHEAGVDIVTLGQYLRPGPAQLPVVRYVPPKEFERWKDEAIAMGFGAVMAGPFVRSSYQAREAFDTLGRGTDADR